MALDVPKLAPPKLSRWQEAVKSGRGFFIHYLSSLDRVSVLLAIRPAYSIEGDDYTLFRIDLETNELIGVEIEDAGSWFLPKHPEWSAAYTMARSARDRQLFAAKIAQETARAVEHELQEALAN